MASIESDPSSIPCRRVILFELSEIDSVYCSFDPSVKINIRELTGLGGPPPTELPTELPHMRHQPPPPSHPLLFPPPEPNRHESARGGTLVRTPTHTRTFNITRPIWWRWQVPKSLYISSEERL